MTNSEERYTAWLDGGMDDRERKEFEATLDAAAHRDAAEWRNLRGLLREVLQPASMPHADFVNSQVLEAIHREMPAPRQAAPARGGWLPVRWLAGAGVFLLALAAGLSVLVLPHREGGAPGGRDSIVLAANPKFGAVAFAAPGGKGTVLWVNDAGYIPADEGLK
jgi:anti-sigma factor RsiW